MVLYFLAFTLPGVQSQGGTTVSGETNYPIQTTSVIHDILYPGPAEAKKRFLVARRKQEQYCIKELRGMKHAILATVAIQDIEQVFLQKFTEQLRDTARFEDYEAKIDRSEETKRIEGRRKTLLETIAQLTERIDGIFMTLQSTALEPDERDDFVKERRRLIQRKEKVQNELKIQSPVQVYLQYKDLIEKMGQYWERYPFEDRQALVALLIRRVYLEPLSHHFIKVTIEWKEFPSDEGVIWRRHADSLYWDEEEDDILSEMYPTEPAEAIQQAMPRRSWSAIQSRASERHIKRLKKPGGVCYRKMSLEDMQIAACYGISLENLGEPLFAQWVYLFHGSR